MTVLDIVTAWVLSFIIVAAPPGRKIYYPEGQETRAEAEMRYRDITRDVIEVVYDPNEKPLFKGPNGRARTVSVVLSVMLHESSFMKHVDYNIGKYARGDQGKSWCLMQIKIDNSRNRTMRWNRVKNRPPVWNDPPEEIDEGYTGDELIADRKLCIREGMKILRLSFGACSKYPLNERLRNYASGTCEKGGEASKARMNLAIFWFQKSFKNQFTDEQVIQTLLHKAAPEVIPEPTQEPGPPLNTSMNVL